MPTEALIDWLLSNGAAEALIGLSGGVLLGLAARRGRFCTLGAIEDVLYAGDWRRVRMWALALGLSIIGVQIALALEVIALDDSVYATIAWDPVASIVGGLLFGYGMAMAGNCGYGALARLGGGDLRSFVIVLVVGISAYMAAGGPLAGLRQALFPRMERGQDSLSFNYADSLGAVAGVPAAYIAIAVAALFIGWAVSSRSFLSVRAYPVWSAGVALAIVGGWIGTTWVAGQAFHPVAVESYTFSAPPGEAILYVMTASGGGLSFGVGSIAGVIIGALAGSLSRGHFHWEACDDPRELGRQMFGAFLMGTGGVIALGCSIGQGLTAFSTLAHSAPVVLLCVLAGAIVGLRQLVEGTG